MHKIISTVVRADKKKLFDGRKIAVPQGKLVQVELADWKSGDKAQVVGDDRGPWTMTFTGRHFHFTDPSVDEVDFMDIAVATSRECRFAGHSWSFYCVAQHQVYVSERMELLLAQTGNSDSVYLAKIGMLGLLHDASEAYIKDMPSPVKAYLPEYTAMEAKIQECIMTKFGLIDFWKDSYIQSFLHKVDKGVMSSEVRDLIKHKKVWQMPEKAYDDLHIIPVASDTACVQFLYRFNTLLRAMEPVN